MISIPAITSVWMAVTCGPLVGLLAAIWSALALFSWFLLSPPNVPSVGDGTSAGPVAHMGVSIEADGPRSARCVA